MKKLILLSLLIFINDSLQACVNFWNANLNEPNVIICPSIVKTVDGQFCQLPFTYQEKKINHCIINYPNSSISRYIPKCLTHSEQWSACVQPTDAIIDYVTTRKNRFNDINTVSLNGGTMIWIFGRRFAQNLFAFAPSEDNSNEVFLVNEFNSYECFIHTDKVTSTQITCYSPPMPAGTYTVRVKVKGHLIPIQQYINIENAVVRAADWTTPKLTSVEPISAPPGSMVTLRGNFMTLCYTRDELADEDDCADDNGARITRVYFSGQLCNLIDPNTFLLYQNLTRNTLVCKLEGQEVSTFNASILVSEEYGRSLASSSIFYISADEKIYNFESHAQIDHINYQSGSKKGGLKLTITGSYFYSDEFLKADINIGDEKCEVTDFKTNNFDDSTLECQVPAYPSSYENRDYFFGGRGINVIVDNKATSFSDLFLNLPSVSAKNYMAQNMSVSLNNTDPVTVWFKGYFAPLRSGSYDFTIETNGFAKVYLSLTQDPSNMSMVSSYQNSSLRSSSIVNLEAEKLYFIQSIGSSSSSSFQLTISARFYNTSLINAVSSNVKNEIQEIEIRSTETHEKFEIDYSNIDVVSGDSEVQKITLNSSFNAKYILSFRNVETILLDFHQTSALNLQDALNDLPTLGPKLVTVNPVLSEDSKIKIFRVTFSADLGDVPNLEEKGGNLTMEVEEEKKGVASGNNFQMVVQGQHSPLFKLSDSSDNIKDAVRKTFGIRCPASIQEKTEDVHDVYDFESCSNILEGDLRDTAFCGLCSSKNSRLFDNIRAFGMFKFLCFAYKQQSIAFNRIHVQFRDGSGTMHYRSREADSIADGQWHYACYDIVTNVGDNIGSALTIRATLTPFSGDTSFVDTVSLRKTLPNGYDDLRLMTTRRLYPNVPIFPSSLAVDSKPNEKKVVISYKPNNCLFGLDDILVTNFPNASITRQESANPPVTGTFDLSWNDYEFKDINADIGEDAIRSYLESAEKMRQLIVVRSKNCAGYKWRVTWQTGGSKPRIQIKSSNLSGNSPTILTRRIQIGFALFSPITDNIMRTFHQKPQITVSIGGILSQCKGSCDFEWLNEMTPNVETINELNSTLIKLQGTGFNENKEKNLILIGSTKCEVVSASVDEIECVPGDGPVGSYPYSVNVLGKGFASLSNLTDQARYTFELEADSFSPKKSGTGGGVILSINGKGFTKNTKVLIDGDNCPILNNSYKLITCVVPPNPSYTNKNVSVVVSESDETKAINDFLYDYENTPRVTSISKSKLSVIGDEEVTINGTFSVENIKVYIGSKPVKVVSTNSGSIVIKTPSNEPGFYPLIIPEDTYGNAKTEEQLEYIFYVSSFEPRITSKRGGSLITIYGDGFNSQDCHSNKITFERYSCKVINCSNNYIICETEAAHTVHQITNSGHSPKWGRGYAWDRAYLEINKSDIVTWTWKSFNLAAGLKFMVEQIKNPTLRERAGFWSGPPSESGSFTFQFNKPGTYFYWSGYIEQSKVVNFHGVIVVLDVDEVKNLEIEVTQNEIKALKCSEQSSNVGSNCNPIDPLVEPSCSSQKISQDDCGGAVIANNLRFTSCSVPTITSVSPSNITYETNIIITGTLFSSTECENEVYIGDRLCSILTASPEKIECKIGRNSGLQAFKYHNVEVKVKNKGYALKMNNFIVVEFLAVAEEVTPDSGSTNGGALVTIKGDGFDQSTKVILQDLVYDSSNSQILYDSFKFMTLPNTGQHTLYVYNDEILVYKFDLNYTFSDAKTPKITSVSTIEIEKETNLTINGNNFGTELNEIDIRIGDQICQAYSVSDETVECKISGLEIGSHSVKFNIKSIGNADEFDQKISGKGMINSVEPASGSTNGGTVLKIKGNGFVNGSVVNLGESICIVKKLSVNEIECETQANSAQKVNVTIGGYCCNIVFYDFDAAKTPVISQISPGEENYHSTKLTLTGENFSVDKNEVRVQINGSNCLVESSSLTEIVCVAGEHGAGTFPIELKIDSFGYSNKDVTFNYKLNIHNLNSNEASIVGGLHLKINGSGFSQNSKVFICDNECKILEFNSSKIKCVVPSSNSKVDKDCDLKINENGLSAQKDFYYKSSVTPKILNSVPKRGGTGGGTILTITGENFRIESTKVLISGILCETISINQSTIVCRTGPCYFSSIKALIQVNNDDIGDAINEEHFFEYIDLWSSRFTWGGLDPPGEGEVAVIDENQIVYFDAKTPILKGILIIGGALIFDDMQDVHLKCEYIIIVENGLLQIGTEQKPFLHKAEITMYGSARSIELPIFGSKVIALRSGTIDMHGKPVGITWTQLGQTADAGSSQIELKEPVIWENGSEIVIATTGNHFSVGESEVRTIINKSADNKVLTLDQPLKFTHLSVEYEVGESPNNLYKVEKRAEIGLLTRNIKFRGNNDESWNSLKSAKACPQGFNPSEFATQTCFLGRYGDEIGSNEFGAQIMIHADMDAPRNKEHVIARIQNVELFHVGQSFRLGRYPIHFHLNGDMPSSYVRECSIRKSFNRAVNVHGTHYVKVSRNFIYDIMGGAYFLEDSVEIGNEFSYNLAIFVKTSSSLLTEDSTPAAYWITNPNNTVIHNSVAGGSHFGYWYRFLDRPDGPSFNRNYCPKKIPLGRFFNNSVHSSGRIGLWIFPGYTPSRTGGCWDSTPSVAKFEKLISYSNEKGAEWVFSNSLQFINFIVFDEDHVGIETKNNVNHPRFSQNIQPLVATFYNQSTGTAILDSVIIGNSKSNDKTITQSGLVLAWDRGQLIKNVTFINFPTQSTHAMRGPEIIGICTIFCGGWTTKLENLKFFNVQTRAIQRWDSDLILDDLDGSLTDELDNVVVYNNNFTSTNPKCKTDDRFINGSICKNTKSWIRFSFNKLDPELVQRINITNSDGNMIATLKLGKRLTHLVGFMNALEANNEYLIELDQALYPTNISYTSGFYNVEPGKWIIIKHKMWKKPDRVMFGNKQQIESFVPLTTTMDTGRWHWNNSTQTLSYLINNNKNVAPFIDHEVLFDAHVCRYAGCQPPIQPGYRLPVKERPINALFWSDIETWSFLDSNVRARQLNAAGSSQLPQEGQSVKIPDGKYIVVDCPIPKLKNLEIEGVLEFDNGLNHTLNAELIFINGGQLIIGWENDPMLNNVDIILRGTKESLNFFLPNGINNIGGKGIGVYGGLDLHGKARKPIWTTIEESCLQNSSIIKLAEPVDWMPGEMIIIGSTSYHPNQTEIFEIVSKSNDNKVLTLNSTFLYDHLAYGETYPNGESYHIAAPVGLLTRNIKIIGEQYPNQFNDLYGSRTIVSDYSNLDSEGNPVFYKGFARLSNVEFDLFGQFNRGNDRKYGILFSNLGDYNYSRPSYVRNCSFHHGFTTAIGIQGSNSIPIENNIVHRTLDFGIYIEAHSNIIRRNLILYILWSSSILTWEARFNGEYWGAIDAHQADSVIIEDNFICGVERLALFYKGQACDHLTETVGLGMNNSIKRNTIYCSMAGVVILPEFFHKNLTCLKISEFTIFKTMHWAIYYQGTQSVILDSNKLIDNYVSAFTYVIRPPPILHLVSNKFYINKNSLIVGQSSGFNCLKDVKPFDLNYNSAVQIQAFGVGKNLLGKTGLVWSNFLGKDNGAPVKPWAGLMTFNKIDGNTTFDNLTITNFNEQCGVKNYVLSTNKDNDDGQHPVMMKNIHLYQVENSSKVWIHRPNLHKINIWDCIDMDCDAMKKALLNDLDGSFLGEPGTVIPQSEYQWGNQQRGLGDFRIPKEMLAAPNGSMIPPNQVYKYPGIVRDRDLCKYIDDWQAYKCHGIEHRILIIESMDPDTLGRRISPVAILVNNTYLDLINGPQDHGCCFGYTCLERLSTFMAIIASELNTDIYLTGTPPTQLRFRILNSDPEYKIRLSMHYFTSNRIDLYKNDRFFPPTNAYYSNGNMQLNDTTGQLEKFMPHFSNASGTNLAVRQDSKIYFTIGGGDYIDLKVTPTIFVKFGVPAITESSFFNRETLVLNFADLLGIPASKIRRVNIIRESPELRKKRSADTVFIELTIMDDPINDISMNDEDMLIRTQMNNISSSIINRFSTGVLQQQAMTMLNVSLTGLSVQKPDSNGTEAEIKMISKLVGQQDADRCKENVPCEIQPILKVLDENDNILLNMGNDEFAWTVLAEIYDSASQTVRIVGQKEAHLKDDGFVRFESMIISEIASNFKIRYRFLTPPGLIDNDITLPSYEPSKLISSSKAEFSCISDNDNMVVVVNQTFVLNVSVIDKFFGRPVQNLDWKNHTWQAEISIHQLEKCQPEGTLLVDSLNRLDNLETGLFSFENLKITKTGLYLLSISFKTSDLDYEFSCLSKSLIVSREKRVLDDTVMPSSYFTFGGNFENFKHKTENIKAAMYNCYLEKYSLDLLTPISVYSGSVMVNFDFTGNAQNVTLFGQDVAAGIEIVPGLPLISAILNDKEIAIEKTIINPPINENPDGNNQKSGTTQMNRALSAYFIIIINFFIFFY